MNLFDLVAKLSLDSSEYEYGLQAVQRGLNAFKKVTLATFAASSAAFIGFAKDAVSTGMAFDSAMSQVAATMGVSVDQIQNLRDFAQQMGATTKFTATEAAQALNYMALAGYDAEKSMSMLPTVLNLAAAGGFDLARASDMVTDAQSALGLTIEQTTIMVDQMAKTASKSNTSVEQLGDAMLTIGGTAKFMAGGTDRLQTVLGLLADNGIKGSEAGTHLRNMLLKLSSPTKDGTAALKNLGVKVFDASGNMRDMQEIMLDMSQAMDSLTAEQRVQAISDIFNARDLSAVNALLGTSKERWEQLGGAIAEATGSAQQMSQTQLGNLTGDITIMKSAVEGLKIQFSDGVTPEIRDVIQRITTALQRPKTQKFLREVGEYLGKLIKRITELVSNVVLPKVISLFDNGAKKLKVFGGIALGLVGTIKAVTTAMGLLAGTVSPTGLLIKGIGLLIGAFTAVSIARDDYINNMGYLTEQQRKLVESIDDTAEAQNEVNEAYRDSASAAMTEKGRVTDLWKELQTLVAENGEVKKGMEARVDFILNELNSALGTEYERNGNIISQYQDMQGEIDNLIQKQAAEALIAAGKDKYTEALQKREEALLNAGKAHDELAKKQDELTVAQNEYNDALERYEYLSDGTEEGETKRLKAMQPYEKALSDAQRAVDRLSLSYTNAQNVANGYYADVERYEKAQLAILEGNYQEAQNILTKDYDYSLEIQRKKAADNIVEEAKYRKMLKEKRAAIEEYRRNVFASEEGFHADMLKTMIAEYNKEVEEARKAGFNIGTALGVGMSEAKAEVEARAGYLITGAIDRMKKIAQIASPSKVGRGIGKNIGSSVGLGLEDSEDYTISAAEALSSNVLNALDETPDGSMHAGMRYGASNSDSAIVELLREIRDSMGFDVVLSDGALVGRIDKLLGRSAMQKARGNA